MPRFGKRLLAVLAIVIGVGGSALILAGAFAQGTADPKAGVSIPSGAVSLPEDADGILSPDARDVAMRFGLTVTISAPSGHEVRNGCVFSGAAGDAAPDPCRGPLASDDSYLQLLGQAEWADGEGRLRVGEGTAYPNLACVQTNDALAEALLTCFVSDAAGDPPRFSVAADAAGEIGVVGNLKAAGSSGRFQVAYQLYDAEAETTVDEAQELDTRGASAVFASADLPAELLRQVDLVTLGLADQSQRTEIATSASVGLALGVLNENGRAADPARAISSINLTATAGAIGTVDGDLCTAGSTCTIDLAALRSDARTNPDILKDLPLTYTAPADSGTATIAVQVVAAGEVEGARLAMTVIGQPSGLTIGSAGSVLNEGTRDEAPGKDDLDEIRLTVSAADSAGHATALPPGARVARISGPGGNRVGSEIAARVACGDSRLKCDVVIDVEAARPLAVGTYAVEVEAGALAGEAEFTVAGRPAEIRTEQSPIVPAGRTITIGIEVADAAGNAVADGTPVRIETRGRLPGSVLRVVTPGGGAGATKSGRLEARLVVVGREVGVVTISAGAVEPATNEETGEVIAGRSADTARILVIDTRNAMSPASCGPAELSNAIAGSFATWLGPSGCLAASVLSQLPGVSNIQIWNGRRWLRYAETAGGEPLPGALNFELNPNDIVWLGG